MAYRDESPLERRGSNPDKGYESYFRPHVEIALGKLQTRLEASRGAPTLNLADSFIGDDGCEIVAKFIKDSPNLTTLELRGNNIGPDGASALGNAVALSSSIRNLSLEWNSIANGTSVLAEAMTRNSSITNLDLRNNRIGPEGIAHIAKMLEVNRTLVRLDLRWNEIGPTGARALLSSLARNQSLQSLELSGNKVPEEMMQELEAALRGDAPRTEARPPPAAQEPVIPIKILNKEKEFAEEVNQKIESQLLQNTRSESRIAELEMLFDQERKKAKEVREDLSRELENELRQKSHIEEACYGIQDEMNRREMEDARIIQDLEMKLGNITNEHHNMRLEYERTHDQLEKLESSSTERIQDLEDRILKQQNMYKDLDETSKVSYDRLKQEQSVEVQELTREYEAKLAALEGEISAAKDGKEKWEFDYQTLHQNLITERNANEAEFSRVETKVREEETHSANTMIRNLENRMKILEESREALTLKNQEMQREMIRDDKRNMEQLLNLEAYVSQLRQEKIELENQVSSHHGQKEELNAEIDFMRQNIDRTHQEKEGVLRGIQQRKDAHKSQMEQTYKDHDVQRKSYTQMKAADDEHVFDMKGQVTEMRKKVAQIKSEHDRLKEMILHSVEEAVSSTVYQHIAEL